MKTLIDNNGEDRLRAFLKTVIEERRPTLSAREVARRCERYGYKVNESYISQFLSGARRSLSFRALKPISCVLGVSYVQLLMLAGYVSEEEMGEIARREASTIEGEEFVEMLDLSPLSPAGKKLVREYYDFIHMKDMSLAGRKLVKEFYEFSHGIRHLEPQPHLATHQIGGERT